MFNSMNAMIGRMALSSLQRQSFDEINSIIESSTNDMLLQPDWDANMTCCDLVKNIIDPVVLNEVFMALKRKLTSKKPMTVFLALNLIETLVKNCGTIVYPAINEESFMKELAKVVKRYQPLMRNGGEERDVAELSTDIIQAWGEAFMRRREYPNISKAYLDLRREGVQFRTEVDQTKVPTFSPPAIAQIGDVEGDDDGLALAIQASLQMSGNQSSAGIQTSNLPAGSGVVSAPELAAMIANSSQMLKDIICAFSSPREAQQNEIAEEVAQQLRDCLKAIEDVMGEEIEKRPESVDMIFKTCEGGNRVLGVFTDLKNGSCTVAKASSMLSQTKIHYPPSSPVREPSTLSSTVSELWHQGDLLGFETNQSAPAPTFDFADFSAKSAAPAIALNPLDISSPQSAPLIQSPPSSRQRSLSKLTPLAPPPRESSSTRRKPSNAPPLLQMSVGEAQAAATTPAFDLFTPTLAAAPVPPPDSSSLLLSAFDEPFGSPTLQPVPSFVAQPTAPSTAPVDSILSMFDSLPVAPPQAPPYGHGTASGLQPYGMYPPSQPFPAPTAAPAYSQQYAAPVYSFPAGISPQMSPAQIGAYPAAPLPANEPQTPQNPFDLF